MVFMRPSIWAIRSMTSSVDAFSAFAFTLSVCFESASRLEMTRGLSRDLIRDCGDGRDGLQDGGDGLDDWEGRVGRHRGDEDLSSFSPDGSPHGFIFGFRPDVFGFVFRSKGRGSRGSGSCNEGFGCNNDESGCACNDAFNVKFSASDPMVTLLALVFVTIMGLGGDRGRGAVGGGVLALLYCVEGLPVVGYWIGFGLFLCLWASCLDLVTLRLMHSMTNSSFCSTKPSFKNCDTDSRGRYPNTLRIILNTPETNRLIHIHI
eukprot:854534-Amorphochlora_amoeboformis.AAC.1